MTVCGSTGRIGDVLGMQVLMAGLWKAEASVSPSLGHKA